MMPPGGVAPRGLALRGRQPHRPIAAFRQVVGATQQLGPHGVSVPGHAHALAVQVLGGKQVLLQPPQFCGSVCSFTHVLPGPPPGGQRDSVPASRVAHDDPHTPAPLQRVFGGVLQALPQAPQFCWSLFSFTHLLKPI